MRYRKPGNRLFEITGEVETLKSLNGEFVYIVTSKRHERRDVTRIEAPEEVIKQFIPYLYKIINAQFIKGCVFIKEV
jgi:hypothetical protein